jgi:transcriptional regulator with XRE-family HTH domain
VLRKWRKGKRIKIQTAAVEMGVSPAARGHWETGTRFPQGKDLLRLLNYTGLSLPQLLCPHADSCPFPGGKLE